MKHEEKNKLNQLRKKLRDTCREFESETGFKVYQIEPHRTGCTDPQPDVLSGVFVGIR